MSLMPRACTRRRVRLTLVSKLHPEANPFDPPPPYKGHGRPPVKGPRRPKPSQAAVTAELRDAMVAWYGGGTRSVGIASGSGHRYKADQGFVEIAWVFVRDRTGTHRDESFSSTDPTMGPAAMVEAYAGRWNIETTFQELRGHLGLERRRGGGAGGQSCGRRRACSVWIRSWPCCIRPCQNRSGPAPWIGRARPA